MVRRGRGGWGLPRHLARRGLGGGFLFLSDQERPGIRQSLSLCLRRTQGRLVRLQLVRFGRLRVRCTNLCLWLSSGGIGCEHCVARRRGRRHWRRARVFQRQIIVDKVGNAFDIREHSLCVSPRSAVADAGGRAWAVAGA
eukprot:scaffold4009_cov101-Isochrysis_galbana.AAC.5